MCSMKGFICGAPKAQFMPTEKIGYGESEARKASTVCPLSVRPARSLTVRLTMMGKSTPCFLITARAASIIALQLSVSKMVSMRITSTPPSTSPSTCSHTSLNSSS